MKRLIIFGIGDIAQIANDYFELDSDYKVEAFTVDREYLQPSFENKPVVAFDELASHYPPAEFELFIALSYKKLNQLRAKKYEEAKKMGYQLASYVSSKCNYLSKYKPGDNCFIFEDNTVQPYVKIGNNVFLWSGNHIGHHSVVEDHNFISSHVVISGHCYLESFCFFGVNSSVHNNVRIRQKNLIGAGAVISKDTIESGVYLPPKTSLFAKRSDEIDF